MKCKAYLAVILAAITLFTLTACGKTQPPAAPNESDAAFETEAAPTGAEEAPAEEPWKTALAEDLFEKYGVLPEYYEDLGDGIYQVYVEVGGEVVPFVTVNSATGDYHG